MNINFNKPIITTAVIALIIGATIGFFIGRQQTQTANTTKP